MINPSSTSMTDSDVTCIACGTEVPRADAREYDKYGDRWQRDDKQFEHMCKSCHGAICHQPRSGLESTLVNAEAVARDRESFLERFLELERTEHS